MIGNDKRNEILLALKIIKHECLRHSKCEDCPFHKESSSNLCAISRDTPASWDINDDEKWKAFK